MGTVIDQSSSLVDLLRAFVPLSWHFPGPVFGLSYLYIGLIPLPGGRKATGCRDPGRWWAADSPLFSMERHTGDSVYLCRVLLRLF